jgi:DNA modification methylase
MADGTIYAGNMRYRAVATLPAAWRHEHFGADGIPAVLEDVSLELAKERAVRDNGSWGEWAEPDLAEILAGLKAEGVDIGLLGLASDHVERLLALVGLGDMKDDADFDPTPPRSAHSRPGDLYLLGEHRLVCGDGRDRGTWEALFASLEGAPAQALWTDPPYGVELETAEGAPAIAGDTPTNAVPLLRAVLAQADRWLVAGAPVYITGPSGRLGALFAQLWEELGWHLAQSLIWVKNSFVPGRSDYHHQHEVILYGWKPGAAHTWLGALDRSTVVDEELDLAQASRAELVGLIKELRSARRTDVVREDKTRHNDLHPTMKPTGLIRQLLANSTRQGALVLDPFAGSGSTLVAAEQLGRRAALIELEPSFCDVIVRRWESLAPGNTAELVRGG